MIDMIFYFSGTGNSRWIAENLADCTAEMTADISKLTKVPDLSKEKMIGLVFPIYAWGIPEPMLSFAKKLRKTDAFTFGVCTCGADAGIAMKLLSKIYPLDSSYSVVMPNNYVIGSELEDRETVLQKLDRAKEELQFITKELLQKKKVYRVTEGSMAFLKSAFINKGFNKLARTTKPFYVTDKCNGCNLCVRNCPADTIRLDNGKPVWNQKCYQCLRCINECPQTAIQYGTNTEKRGRYTIQKYL